MPIPTGTLIYAHPTDNIVDAVVPTVSVAPATGYPLSNIYDKRPESRYVASAVGAVRFTWDFGTPVAPAWIALVMPNIPAATAGVVFEGNSANSWPGAVSVPITISPWAEDGFPWNPYAFYNGGTAYRYWSLYIPAFAAPFSVGEIAIIGTYREMQINIDWGADLTEKHPVIEHVTDGSVYSEYDRGQRWMELSGEVQATDVGRQAVRAWIRSARGRSRRFFIIPDPSNVWSGDVHAWMVKFQSPDLMQKLAFLDWTTLTLGWQELSRGLAP